MLIRTRELDVSYKDATALIQYIARYLKKNKEKEVNFTEIQTKLKNYSKQKEYFPVKYGGAAHKKGVGPGRKLTKVLNLLLKELKSFKTLSKIKKIDLIYLEIKKPKKGMPKRGVVRAARGSGFRKDPRICRIVFDCSILTA